MHKLHRLMFALAAVLIGPGIQAEQSAFPPQESSTFPSQKSSTFTAQQPSARPVQQRLTSGYLGIGVDRVKPSVKAHYPDGVAETSGLIVTRFADKSPAADDGIKLHDILISYDEQPIEAPEKFIKKVREDKPGRVAKLKLVRQGEVLTVPVTIGKQKVERRMAPVARFPQIPPQYWQKQSRPTVSEKAAPKSNPNPNAKFDGLAIRKMGGDIYDASIGFTAWDGSRQRRSFKGTREQILQQIMRARDLPPEARQQLLFAVKPRKKKSSGWGGMPFGDGNMFDPGSFFKGWGF